MVCGGWLVMRTKGWPGVVVLVKLAQLLHTLGPFLEASLTGKGVTGAEDTPGHWDEVGQESDPEPFLGQRGQFLDYFRQVPVAAQPVGEDVLVHFGIVVGQVQGAAAAGDPGLAVDYDIGLNEPLLHHRGHGKNGAGGVAAGVGNEMGPP